MAAEEASVLAIDTASPAPAIALRARGTIFEESLSTDRRASEELLPALRRCLARANLSLTDVSRLALCAGPGSFTGLRVGLATAWALARATGIPVEAVSTLESMAEAWRDAGEGPVWTALDAGRGDVVFQEFGLEGPRAEPRTSLTRANRDLAARATRGGHVLSLPRELLAADGPALPLSPARALALAAARAPRAAEAGPPQAIYSRASAAEEIRGPA